MSNIREVIDFSNYSKIFKGGKMAKKKMNRAERIKNEIEILKSRINVLFINRGYGIDKMLILDIVEVIIDYRGESVKEELDKLSKRLFKEKKK